MPAMNDDAKRAALAQVDFFKGCTERELTDIAHRADERDFAPGDELCHESAFDRIVFVVVDGESHGDRSRREGGGLGPADVVGELAMLGDGRRTATLTASTPMTVILLEPDEVDSVLAADPSSAQRIGRRPKPE